VQVACNISLKSSQWELQLCFKPHFNRRFARKVMCLQNRESLNFGNFGTPKSKCHLVVSLVARHIVYYKGEGGGFPQVQAVVSLMNLYLPVVHLCTKSAQTMH
jgi:hypothetical protein